MRKVILPIFVAFLVLVLTSCTDLNFPNEKSADNKIEEKSIKYKIEKIILSKGYQSLEPNVKILEKDKTVKILVSLGLFESSGIEINKITKNNNEINIYTNRLLENDNTQLTIPQAIVKLSISDEEDLEDIKFNIINGNYDPIELKFGKAEILNKIYAQFKIAPNTTPEVNLVREKESFIWNIDFNSISDKDNLEAPLVDLHIKADANTGEIVHTNKKVISEYIDDGLILDYISDQNLLYKQDQIDSKKDTDMLWMYNLKNGEKEKIYETKDSIYSAHFSPDNRNIALIENDEEVSNIYLINVNEKTAKKITPIDYKNTWNIKWKDEDNLYFINNDTKNKSTLFKYNISNKDAERVFSVDKNISDFDFRGETFIFTQLNEKKVNENIYITEDGSTIVEIDKGYRISFLDDDSIVYLKNLEEEDSDIIYIYNLKNSSKISETELNIKDYIKLDSNNLLIIAKNSCNNDYTLVKYNIIDKLLEPIAEITGEVFFYDKVLNKGYISISPPIENDKKHTIYSIDLNKVNKK